jgi:uncharacterized protein YcbK (DUF882 family)
MFEAYPIADRLSAREARGPLHVDLLLAWNKFRPAFGAPVEIVSGYRSPEGNASIGGSPKSMHMVGRALDLHCPTKSLWDDDVFALLLECGFRGIGREMNPFKLPTGGYRGRVHVDVREGPPAFFLYTGEGAEIVRDEHAYRMAKLVLSRLE